MKKKISITMCLMTAVSVIITAVMISLVIYRKNYNEMKSMIRAEAEYISQAIDTEDINYLESVKNVTPSRITWIDSNGNVIYDSAGENLSNHSDRPEIIDAVKNGSGESSRLSDEQMTAYTNELLNDPEKLDDMQQIDGESIEEWKKRTKRSTEYDYQWNDRMMYAKSLYALQNSYQKSGVDGDDANDKIADTIRKLQQSSVDPYRQQPIPDPWEDPNTDVSD